MNNPDNIPSGVESNFVKIYYDYQSMLLGIMKNLDISFSGSTGVTSSTSTEAIDALRNYFNSLGPLPTATNDVDLETFCDNAVKRQQELYMRFRNTANEHVIMQISNIFVQTLLDFYKSLVEDMKKKIKTLPYKPPPPYVPGTYRNSQYTDCSKQLYSSESAYYQCEQFNKLNAPGPQKKQGTPDECFPTYGKSSPAVCAPDTTGRCTNGLMNTTGFPPCCNDNVPPSCIIKETREAPPNTPSGSSSVPPPLVNSSVYTSSGSSSITTPVSTPVSTKNLSRAAANCVARNPNYPVEIGSCVYNPSNPCPTKYETTDSRFGTKMCCAPETSNNAACFSSKSRFGSSSDDNNNSILILLFAIILLFILMKKK